jgi:diguanylate cyclase
MSLRALPFARTPIGLLVLLVLVGQVVAVVDAGARSLVLGLSLLVLDILGAVFGLRAARHSPFPLAWRMVAAGRTCSLISTVTFIAAVVSNRPIWWWTGALAGIAMFACLSMAVLSGPVAWLRGREGWAFFAEIMTVLVAGFMAVWYLILQPLLVEQPTYQWVYRIGFPVGNLMLLAAVSAVLLRGTITTFRHPAAVLLGGMLLYVVGDIIYAAMGVHIAKTYASPLAGTVLVIASLLMTVSTMWQAGGHTMPARDPERMIARTWPGHLPYVALTLGNALMLVVALREGQLFLWGGLVLGQIVMTGFVSLRQIITLRESRDRAVSDPLTGLANRSGLDAGLERALRRGQGVAVLLIDLDDFKLINDAYGHAAGDTVLTHFARLLRDAVRTTDIAARVGGDEFTIVLTDITDTDQAITVAQRILAATAATPVRLGGDTIPVRASIGVSVGAPGEPTKEILRRADVAMYQAKRAGDHGWQLYDPSMIDRRARDAALADDLTSALETDQFQVLYQPMVSLADGRPLGVEALLRWHHPQHGMINPLDFIPIAERTGLINPIGLWVLRQACRQVASWQERLPPGQAVYVSVNVSPRQLQEHSLVRDILDVLGRSGLPPQNLVLEVTESAVVDEKVAIPALRALREHGIRIAIDDFGTGYSSLHYLTRLPVDILKVDRSFVNELNGTSEGSAVTEAILRLSQVLHLSTVAEGIETEAQAAELRALGCTVGQGYLFSRPQTAQALNARMTAPTPAFVDGPG